MAHQTLGLAPPQIFIGQYQPKNILGLIPPQTLGLIKHQRKSIWTEKMERRRCEFCEERDDTTQEYIDLYNSYVQDLDYVQLVYHVCDPCYLHLVGVEKRRTEPNTLVHSKQ